MKKVAKVKALLAFITAFHEAMMFLAVVVVSEARYEICIQSVDKYPYPCLLLREVVPAARGCQEQPTVPLSFACQDGVTLTSSNSRHKQYKQCEDQ